MDDALALALEEYKTLRQEILNSITAQYSILTFGAVAVGVLATAVLNQSEVSSSAASVFVAGGQLVGIPLLCLLVVAMWMNEVTRMLRAGFFLRGLEGRLNALVPVTDAMSWENTVHEGDGPDVERTQFRLVVLFYGTLALAFVGFGLYQLWTADEVPLWLRTALTVAEVLLLLVSARVLYAVAREYVRQRAQWRSEPAPST